MKEKEKFKHGEIVQHFNDGVLLKIIGYQLPAGSSEDSEFVECVPVNGHTESERLIFHESALIKLSDLTKPGMPGLLSKLRSITHPPRNVA